MNTFKRGDRVIGQTLGNPYTGTVDSVGINYRCVAGVRMPETEWVEYWIASDDRGAIYINPKWEDTSIRLIVEDPTLPDCADYDYREDTNAYPFENVVYAESPAFTACTMFAADANAVTVVYVDGFVQANVAAVLSDSQVKAFCYGAQRIAGVKSCGIDKFAPFSEDYTSFEIGYRPGIAGSRILEIKRDVQTYAETFLTQLTPVAAQASMF